MCFKVNEIDLKLRECQMVPGIKGIILLKFFSVMNFVKEVLCVVREKYTKILCMSNTLLSN